LINRPLNHLQERLDGRLLAEIEGGQEVTLSRRRARAFRELMSM
jgi:DNA-binding LytR/AlgR family response regulator